MLFCVTNPALAQLFGADREESTQYFQEQHFTCNVFLERKYFTAFNTMTGNNVLWDWQFLWMNILPVSHGLAIKNDILLIN